MRHCVNDMAASRYADEQGQLSERETAMEQELERIKAQCSPALREALRLASDKNHNYIRIEYLGVTDTLAGHARRLGLSRMTVYKRNKRQPGDWAYVFADGKHIVLPSRKSGWHQNTFRFGRDT